MFKALSDWWNRDKITMNQRLDQLAQDIARERADRDRIEAEKLAVVQEKETVEAELGVFRQQAAEDEARRNGTEPWVEIKSERIDPVKGIQIELDWNDAFIQYLKDSGITGRDEETVVQRWIAFLYQDLLEKLEQQVIDNSDKKRPGDFE
jgi:hypothetical protein